MGNYTVISDIGNAIVSILREHMVPDVIMNPESICLCSPDDKGDAVLGVYLYDIRESEEYRNSGMVSMNISKQRYPSSYLTLNYMITAYSNGDIKFRSSEEQKIIGRVIQILADYQVIDPDTYRPVEQPVGNEINIVLQSLTMEDKLKIWTVPNKAYKLSAFFKVGPVELQSSKELDVQRVVDVAFTVKEQRHGE